MRIPTSRSMKKTAPPTRSLPSRDGLLGAPRPVASTSSKEKPSSLLSVPPKEALLCGKEFSVFVLQFNSPRNGLDLGRIPITARYAQQDFSSFGRLARKFEFVPFRLRMIGADYPDKNTGVFRKPCKGVVQFQNEIQTGATFVRPYDDLFAEKFFPGEILGNTQKVVFRPIDLADRGNFCFRIKRRQKGQ